MEGSHRSERIDRERRGAPTARLVAAHHLQSAAAAYGVNISAEQVKELKGVIEREKEKKKASRALIEQLQHTLNARDEQIRVLSSQLVAAHVSGASGSPALERDSERIREGRSEHDIGHHHQHRQSPDQSLGARIRELERENAHLRTIAVTVQAQRDAFERVARNLQTHSSSVEASFIALQGESQVLLRDHHQHAIAITVAKKTLLGYESGLTHLLTLLTKQQEKMRL
jgi:hypothetical protein